MERWRSVQSLRGSSLRARVVADGSDGADECLDVRVGEQCFRTADGKTRERRFVEKTWVHAAVDGEVLDDERNEVVLSGGQGASAGEP
jgi:hypothetical protein